MKRQLAIFGVYLLTWSACVSTLGAQTTQPSKPGLKEQVVLIPQGAVVEVRMKNNQKLRGRLGAVSDSGFEFQFVQNNQTISRTLSYDEVKSVKERGKGMSTAGKVTIGVLAGVGGVFLVLILVAAYALD